MNKLQNKRIASLDVHSASYVRTKNNKYGAGDISDLYMLIDKAATAGFEAIQFNPVQDTGLDPCPYCGISIFSYNPVFLSVDQLEETPSIKLLKDQLKEAAVSQTENSLVDYKLQYSTKSKILRSAYEEWSKNNSINFGNFDKNVLDYALYKALKGKFKAPWFDWPSQYKNGQTKELIKFLPDEIRIETEAILYGQQILKNQWANLKKYAESKGVEIFMDRPAFPAHDGSEVWGNQELFYLNDNGSMQYVSGCNSPDDPFGEQTWGNAVYKYKEKPTETTALFIDSIRYMSEISKIIRIDHALAIIWKYYLINPRTNQGKHVKALKDKILKNLKVEFPDNYFIAEDVGVTSKRSIDNVLEKYEMIGMRCIQWGQPKYWNVNKYPEHCLAATSNHDTANITSWWKELNRKENKIFKKQLGSLVEDEIKQKLTEVVFNSRADIASTTLRDIANDNRRYNTAGHTNNLNWKYRSPLYLEDIDFSSVTTIIKGSKRI